MPMMINTPSATTMRSVLAFALFYPWRRAWSGIRDGK